ncbi:MAG: cytochrome c oxidase subunit [Solirubrobacteraceae bacterium]|nr:cytochrome c oxidase subunit [Solirubrobacteraceae bacterium]
MAPPLTQNRRRRRALAAVLPIAVLAPLALAPSAFAGIFLPESGGSPNAEGIKTLYILLALLGLVIFIGVEGLIVYSMVKFRARKGATAAQIHGNTQLEIGWTVGAAVILIFITVFTFIKLPDIKNPAPSDIDQQGQPVASTSSSPNLYAATDQPSPPAGSARMNITVDGQQYVWRFRYPGKENVFSYTDMVVPVGMTVTLDVTADDVAHSWWIPALGGKADAIPGYVNRTWFKIPLGAIPKGQSQVVYSGQCAELCGRNHANMYGRVVGMRYADWKAWYDGKAADIKTAQEEAAKEHAALQAQEGGQATSGAGGTQTNQSSNP